MTFEKLLIIFVNGSSGPNRPSSISISLSLSLSLFPIYFKVIYNTPMHFLTFVPSNSPPSISFSVIRGVV